MAETHTQFSRRERQIMDVVYTRGQASAKTIESALPDPPGNTAIRTTLRILESKGHLKHKKNGREFVYLPTQPRAKVARSAMRSLLDTFFDGSLEKAVAAHLADPQSKLDPRQLQRLQDLIRSRNPKGR